MILKLRNRAPYVHYLMVCLGYEGFKVEFYNYGNCPFYEIYKSFIGFKTNRKLMFYGYKDNVNWNFLTDRLYEYAKENLKIQPLNFEHWKDKYFTNEIELY